MSDEERPDVIIVGGGLAGLTCALTLATEGEGLEVLVLERGDPPGAKNLSGGRLYLGPLADLGGGLLDDAPVERLVSRETLTMAAESSATAVSFESDALTSESLRSATVLRAKLDGWLADKLAEAGGMVIPGAAVRGPIIRDGRVCGVELDGEEIEADVVVAADGALSPMARAAGLRRELAPSQFVLGVKGIYALDAEKIEDRFNLDPGHGAAELLVGDVSGGLPGGAFLYTNKDSLSLGVVVRVDSLVEGRGVAASELLEQLEQRPEVARRIAGAELVEYGAHLIPEVTPDEVAHRVGDGIVVVGDAAALVINHGITVRGMDLAVASGVLSARAILAAREAGDYSKKTLSRYDALLEASVIGRDVLRFKGAPETLASPWLTRELPELAADLAQELYSFGARPKERLSSTTFRHLRKRLFNAGALRELYRLRRL